MLRELHVKGFGIIDDVTWLPDSGLNVITGETGAGKSMVVDAIQTLLSGQADADSIRLGSDEAVIEAIFQLDERSGGSLKPFLDEKGITGVDDSFIIRGEYRRSGRSAPRINGVAVSKAVLREIGEKLIDIHSQSEHLALLDKNRHLEYLDRYAGTAEAVRSFGVKAAELRQMERELSGLILAEKNAGQQLELLRYQVDEIEKAAIADGEDEELEKEIIRLTSAEELKMAAAKVYGIIYGSDTGSVTDIINEAVAAMRQLAENDPYMAPRLEELEGLQSGLTELARDTRSYGENIIVDPERLGEAQGRLDLIRTLKRKYGGSIESINSFLTEASGQLEKIGGSGERKIYLEEKIKKTKLEMGVSAGDISDKRKQAGVNLSRTVKLELADLNMDKVEFSVELKHSEDTDGLPLPDGKHYDFTDTGIDEVSFIAATNPGEPMKPLDKIASTGEISRFMLALKVALAQAYTTPVLIFDEIDIGVGGRSGDVIGRKLWNLSLAHQVVCVTHLPQIAVYGNSNYTVGKQLEENRTISRIKPIKGGDLLNEIAVMIAGEGNAENSVKLAGDLLSGAADFKKSR